MIVDLHLLWLNLCARVRGLFSKPKPLSLDDLYRRLFMRENRLARLRELRASPDRVDVGNVLDQLIAKDTALVHKAQDAIDQRIAFIKSWQKQADDDFQEFSKAQDAKREEKSRLYKKT